MTDQQYTDKLDVIKLMDPEHPMIDELDHGNIGMNPVYLETLFNELKTERDWKLEPDDNTRQNLNIQLTNLFGKRAKLSNTFHDAQDDNARGDISDAIRSVQLDIESLMNRIDMYNTTGVIQAEKQRGVKIIKAKAFNISDTALGMVRQRNSLRSAISRYKKELQQLHAKNPEDPQIASKEMKLAEKQINLAYVEKAIEATTVHGT